MDPPLLSPCLHRLSTTLYTSCLREARTYRRLRIPPQIRPRHSTANIAPAGQQASPIDGYYAELLSHPLSGTVSATRTQHLPPLLDQLPKTDREAVLQKTRIVFGSRLAGPAERRAELERKSVNVYGIMVPPRPEEPDNCCMSGCVNCVWDRYRDELEEWAEKSAMARERVLDLQQKKKRQRAVRSSLMDEKTAAPTHIMTSTDDDDDDGDGSEGNWDTDTTGALNEDRGKGDLFGDIPVGIREFMRTEKMLKERHRNKVTGLAK